MWGVSFKKSLRLLEEAQYRDLLGILSNVFLCKDFKDSRIWKTSISRELSTKAFYLALEGNQLPKASSSLV